MPTRISSIGLIAEIDPAALFVYPEQLRRTSLQALPAKPGVYIFRDERDLPLYVGKSVNIRSRVLAHLRTPQEARLLACSRYVECRRTAGEIGALLLEARLIKQLQPLHNKKLRRTREMYAVRLEDGSTLALPQLVSAREHDFAATRNLYGLFASRQAALDKLRAMVDAHQLCPAIAGLEKVARGRACFARQLGRCRGACIGAESLPEHRARLRAALQPLQVLVWPYAGPIGIVEESDDCRQIHVIDHWCYFGSVDADQDAASLQPPAQRRFDVDTYNILVKPWLQGKLQVTPLTAAGGRHLRQDCQD